MENDGKFCSCVPLKTPDKWCQTPQTENTIYMNKCQTPAPTIKLPHPHNISKPLTPQRLNLNQLSDWPVHACIKSLGPGFRRTLGFSQGYFKDLHHQHSRYLSQKDSDSFQGWELDNNSRPICMYHCIKHDVKDVHSSYTQAFFSLR